VAYALFVWWFSTGLILWLDGLPRRTFRWSLAAATILAVGALHGLAASSADASVGGAYLAFTCGLVVWGWHEMSFLMGLVTGPRRTALPAGSTGWRRFVHATETILHHELAILATALLILALTWGGANQVGTWTFLLLWGMRVSAKLNVFLGVPNLAEEFLPEHLGYLKSYLAKKPMNLLFPGSVSAATVVAALLIGEAVAIESDPFDVTQFTFLGALMLLAILEHWFLVLPLPDAALWSWALRARALVGGSADVDGGPAGSGGRPVVPVGFERRRGAATACAPRLPVAARAAARAHRRPVYPRQRRQP
jgi:putative photosynthetic complex assembly protein 2